MQFASRLTRYLVLFFALLIAFVFSSAPLDAGEEPVVPVVYLPMIGNPPPPAPPPLQHEMIAIPAGSFTMGCDPAIDLWQCERRGALETPFHTVTLSAYRIDKYEVTNARYAECVAAGDCTAPRSAKAYNYLTQQYYDYYGEAAFANHPVINVSWFQADAFCRATGGRLPTEAEWERAARGPSDRRMWPWGNTLACANANVQSAPQGNECTVGTLTRVGNYATGASPDGVMDMAGNVYEWVNNLWYKYTEDPVTNPQGPESGSDYVLRGGSFHGSYGNFGSDARVTFRYVDFPDANSYDIGFRCVRSP